MSPKNPRNYSGTILSTNRLRYIVLNLLWTVGIDELAVARAELTRLEQKEQQLLQHLIDVRAASKTQRSKIDVLVRERSCMISRLPTELLVRTFSYLLSNYGRSVHSRRHLLASVSRRWRDVILDTPMLWEYIVVCPSDDFWCLEIQLGRGGDAPLDVVMTEWSDWYYCDDLEESLDTAFTSANRWRSLTIKGNVASCAKIILTRMNKIKFPSLRHIEVEGFEEAPIGGISLCPFFLSSINAPVLENISTGNFIAPPGFPAPFKLKSLEATFQNDVHSRLSRPFCFSSRQSLTKLSLSGYTNDWLLERDCITFPVLRSLTLSVTEPTHILAAIVAPMLERFAYCAKNVEASDSTIFGGLGSKFSTVRQLTFFGVHNDARLCAYACGVAFCQAFCGAQTVEINADDVDTFFGPYGLRRGELQCCPLEKFDALESMAISWSDSKWLESKRLEGLNSLVEWLTNRIKSDRGRLRVKLKDITYVAVEDKFTALYNQLRRCCTLELDDITVAPMMRLSMSEHSPLRMVSASPCNIGFLTWIPFCRQCHT